MSIGISPVLSTAHLQVHRVRDALFVLPVVAFGSYALMAPLPVFGIVRFAKTLENSTGYRFVLRSPR